MDRSKVLELAHEAELARQFALEVPFVVDRLQRFAALIEREVRGDAEPVAWREFDGEGGYEYRSYEENEDFAEQWAKRNPNYVGWVKPLYDHPAPAVVRQPLTDDEINSLQLPESGTGTIRDLVRVVELAHGIGGSDE